MIRKTAVLVLVIFLLIGLVSPSLVQAQGGLTVLVDSVVVAFPMQISFSLSARSDVDITDIRLHYTIDRAGFAEVISEVYLEFEPAPSVDIERALDMRKVGSLPPGAILEYWWAVSDDSGDSLETLPRMVRFDDNRYDWQVLTEGEVSFYWYQGEPSFVAELMTAAQQALERLAEDTGAYPQRPVRIYLYASYSDLLGALIFPQEWTGGVAYPGYGVIAIGISPANLDWGRRAVAHEVAHLIIHQVTSNPYNWLPTWLDEGLAMYAEGPLATGFAAYLDRAIAGDDLISVKSLASPFSAKAEVAYLAYAQSYSLVEFLVNRYGKDKMLALLLTFGEGSGYDEALEAVYGFDMNGLNSLWRDYVTAQYQGAGVNG